MQDMQNRVFALGFGPIPFFRRPGVMLHISPNEEDDNVFSERMLGCVVPHRHGVRGCCQPIACTEHDPCYLCHNHPFVEVLFENPGSLYDKAIENGVESPESSEEAQEAERLAWKTVVVNPLRAVMRALPVGTRMLLSVKGISMIIKSFEPAQQEHIIGKIQTRIEHERSSAQSNARSKRTRSERGARRREDRSGRGEEDTGEDQGREQEDSSTMKSALNGSMVRCFLNVTSVLKCVDGFACVAVMCRRTGAKNAGKESKNLYVQPQFLRLPEDEREWDASSPFLYV